jgi:hypothetical protein
MYFVKLYYSLENVELLDTGEKPSHKLLEKEVALQDSYCDNFHSQLTHFKGILFRNIKRDYFDKR